MAKMFDANWTRNQTAEAFGMGMPGASRQSGVVNTLRRQARRRIPVRQILLFVLAVFSFKIFLFLNIGGAAYGTKMAVLSEGNVLERVAGHVMFMDPISEWVVDGVRFGSW